MKKSLVHFILLLGIVVVITPFLWMILTSFKTTGEAVKIPPVFFPSSFQFTRYASVIASLPFGRIYFNTVFSTAVTVCAQILFCSMAGYAFARLHFPGRNILFVIMLSVLMVPGQIFLIPQYMIILKLGLLETIPALFIPNLFSAFGTFLLRQFFLALPLELEEAAIIDGCSPVRIYTSVLMPLVTSGIAALSIFTAKFAWNDFMWPLIVNAKPEKMILGPALATLQGRYINDLPEQMAGAVMVVLPMILLFFIFQKQFIEGVARAGMKV